MKILIAGTPGTGKTTLSRKLSQKLGCEHIDISSFIEDRQAYELYNKDLETYEFNIDAASEALKKYLESRRCVIIDTHSVDVAHFVDFDYIFVLRVPSDILYKRLLQRKYPRGKIKENVECEIFGVVSQDCLEVFPDKKVFTIYSEEDTSLENVFDQVLHIINV